MKVKNVFSLFPHSLNSFRFTHVPECESTQDLALKLALDSSESQLVLCDIQRKGRGRQGSSWMSPPKQSFTCSLAFKLEAPSPHSSYALIPHMAGLAVWKTLSQIDPSFEQLCFKWPNDLGIFHQKEFRKVAGVLVEIKKNILIIGWGLNVFSPAPLSQAMALDEIQKDSFFRNSDFASKLAQNFLELFSEHQKNNGFEDQFLEFLFQKVMKPLWGRFLTSKLGAGKAISLGKDGSLLLLSTKQEIVEIKSGEIILK